MNAIFNSSVLFSIKDLFFILYFMLMIVVSFVFFMEAKLYFQIDIAGIDIPLDEWYASVFK